MRKPQLIKQVLKAKPELKNINTYFYVSPYEHILSGFLYEKVPTGAYVSIFRYPFYHLFDGFSLTFSNRIEYPEGYIDFEKIDKKEVANEFLQRIEPHFDNVYNYLTLEQFYGYLMGEGERYRQHEVVQKVIGYTLLLLDKEDEARDYITMAMKQDERAKGKAYQECQLMLSKLDEGLEVAQHQLLCFESEMKKRVGLK